MREKRKLDFDDIMAECYGLFRRHPEILAMWQRKFQYILVDEFQDISPIQYDVVKMLAAPENNLSLWEMMISPSTVFGVPARRLC